MTDTADFAALCAAIDEGRDDQLPILADWLEEAGDRRSVGLRAIGGDRQPVRDCRNIAGNVYWSHQWYTNGHETPWPGDKVGTNWVPTSVFNKMAQRCSASLGPGGCVCFPSRSAAFLALAEALTT